MGNDDVVLDGSILGEGCLVVGNKFFELGLYTVDQQFEKKFIKKIAQANGSVLGNGFRMRNF